MLQTVSQLLKVANIFGMFIMVHNMAATSELHIPKIAILASGGGSTAEAYARAIHESRIEAEIGLLVVSNEAAGVLDKANRWNEEWGFDVKSAVVSNKLFPAGPRERGQSEEAATEICRLLDEAKVDLVLQLGYMVIGNDPYISEWGFVPERHSSMYQARALNWHPGALPLTADTYGAGASAAMLEAYRKGEVTEAAHTVHVLAQAVDAGPIVAATPVPIESKDDVNSLFERIQLVEKAVTPYVPEQFLKRQAATA